MAGTSRPLELTETLIREHSSPESFRRGEDYYRQGAVLYLIRREMLTWPPDAKKSGKFTSTSSSIATSASTTCGRCW